MNRCEAHDLLNCKCRETLAAWMVRQFAESSNDRVVRNGLWSGDRDQPRVSDGRVLGGEGTR